jgi:hypothetical protein
MTRTPADMSHVLIQLVFDALTGEKQSAEEIAQKTRISNPRRMLNRLKQEGKAQFRIRILHRKCEVWYLSPDYDITNLDYWL